MTRRLEIRLLNYFSLIVLAASIIAIEFFVEINSPELLSGICNTSITQPPQVFCENLLNLRNKIVIMLGILTVVVAIIMLMFIKNISIPLKKMAVAAQKINDGDLTQIITIETQDEIGLVGTAINELTSNLQEVAALTSSTAHYALKDIEAIRKKAKNKQLPSDADINDLQHQLNVLNDFVDSFQLLQTDINK